MDWNNDGKHDWKDDAFYNNLLSDENKQETEKQPSYSGQGKWWSESFFSIIGWTFLILLFTGAGGGISSSIVWICWIVRGKCMVNKYPTEENKVEWVKYLFIVLFIIGLLLFSTFSRIVNP